MDTLGFRFRVECRVQLSRAEIEHLERLSQQHYDDACKQASRSGVISTMRILLGGHDEAEVVLGWNDINLLCKIVEQEQYDKKLLLYFPLRRLLARMMEESERVNQSGDDTPTSI